jgi:uncharacterized membrane protein
MTAPLNRGRAPGAAGPVLGAAALAMGLIAGVFYSYSSSVMLGLARTDDRTFVEVMQRINRAIVNPVFMPVFVGALALPAIAAVLQRRLGLRDAFRWTVAGLALHAVAFIITSGVNVPLNDELARATDAGAAREAFEDPWVRANGLRAVASTLAFACLVRALVEQGRAAPA